jgi:hypothetical protein
MTYFLPQADTVLSAARGLALANPGLIEVNNSPLRISPSLGVRRVRRGAAFPRE